MKRLLILAAALLAATASLTLTASANGGRSLHGTVSALTPSAISISGRGGVVTTCSLGKGSPSTTGVAVGDRVRAVCLKRRHGSLTLAKLRKERPGKTTGAKDTARVTFGGAITALGDASISLHDGDRDLTCTIDSTSPSTEGFKVGQHAKVACAGGVLVSIAPVTMGDAGRWYVGTVSSVDGAALTLTTEHGPVTCKIASFSPSTAGLAVGDRVGMGCKASTMELVLLRRMPAGDSPAPTTHTELKARGSITDLGTGGVSVQTDGGTVSCTLGDHSPSLGDLAVGDAVQMECVDGTLTEIELSDSTGDGTSDSGDSATADPGDGTTSPG